MSLSLLCLKTKPTESRSKKTDRYVNNSGHLKTQWQRYTLLPKCGFPQPLPYPRPKFSSFFPFCQPSGFVNSHDYYLLSSNATLNPRHLMLSLQQHIVCMKRQKLRKINLSKVARLERGWDGTRTQICLSRKALFIPLYNTCFPKEYICHPKCGSASQSFRVRIFLCQRWRTNFDTSENSIQVNCTQKYIPSNIFPTRCRLCPRLACWWRGSCAGFPEKCYHQDCFMMQNTPGHPKINSTFEHSQYSLTCP